MTSPPDFAPAARALAAASRTLITTHVRPDGDAVGSLVGLLRMLRAAGRKADGILLDAAPARFQPLGAGLDIRVWGDRFGPADVAGYDLLAIVDTSARSQLEPLGPLLTDDRVRKLVIDHHQTRDPIGHIELIDESAGATAELLLRLADAAGWTPDLPACEALYVGIATDTGWFRFSNADSRAYRAASRLVEAGVAPNAWYERLFLDEPAPKLRLIGRLLADMELLGNGRVAVMKLPRRLLAECGATPAMTEEIVNEPHRIGSVIGVVMCSEAEDGRIRLNFRSKRSIDVAKIAASFGGGGHARAAGARATGGLDEVASRAAAAMVTALEAVQP